MLSAREIGRVLCRRSYYHFFREFWDQIEPESLADNWHIRFLCDELQAIGERLFIRDLDGVQQRLNLVHNLIVNISPGESKSSICTVFFPVWLWIHDPSLRIITVSYSATLSRNLAQKSRDLIVSSRFQDWFGDAFTLREDKNMKTDYGVLMPDGKPGGSRLSTSVGGSVTGTHAHIIIIDDPLNPKQGRSDAEREEANIWLTSTLKSRKVSEEATPTVLVMQRIHEKDATAHLSEAWAKTGKLRWLRLPADDRYEVAPAELANKYTPAGGLRVMNPKRKGPDVIRDNEAAMMPEDFSGQYGQDPTPVGGNIVKSEWLAGRFRLEDLEAQQDTFHTLTWNATLDGAYTQEKKNAATAVLIWTYFRRKLYVRAYLETWEEFPGLITSVPAFLLANGFTPRSTLYVEPKATGKSLVQTLRTLTALNVVEDPLPEGVTSQQGKVLRLYNVAPFLMAGNVIYSADWDWTGYEKQLTTFPKSSHADLVDVTSMAIEKVGYDDPEASADLWSVESV